MLIRDKKARGFSGKISFIYNFRNKVRGDSLENTLVACRDDGTEITQEEYNILSNNDSTKILGEIDIVLDLNKIKELYFNNNVTEFIKCLSQIRLSNKGKFYFNNGDLEKEEKTLISQLIKYIDVDCKCKIRFSDLNYINIEVNLNKIIKDSSNLIKDNLDMNHAIFMQGVTFADKVVSSIEYHLFSFTLKPTKVEVKREIDINFKNGELPIGVITEGAGVIFDESMITSERLLAFGNKGKNSTTASITIPIELNNDIGLNIEFYCSTEREYDKFSIYKDTEERLCMSGTKSYKIQKNLDNATNLAGDKWCSYPIRNASGSFKLKLLYSKDGSGGSGKDNIFIKRIYSGEMESNYEGVVHELIVKNNKFEFRREANTIISLESSNINKGETFDLLLTNNGNISLSILTSKGDIIEAISKDINLSGEIQMEVLSANGKASNCYLDTLFIINKFIDKQEIDSILRGQKKGFERPCILTGAILPNTSYSLVGSAVLFNGAIPIREVSGDFVTAAAENFIVLDKNSKCIRK